MKDLEPNAKKTNLMYRAEKCEEMIGKQSIIGKTIF